MFVAFHLSISVVDVDPKPDLWNTSLDLVSIRMVRYANFANVLENRCMDAICY